MLTHFAAAAIALLATGADTGERLAEAARDGELERVRELIRDGADVEHRLEGFWETPLLLAAQYGHADVVRALVIAGADLQAVSGNVDHTGMNALDFGLYFGHVDVVQVLLDRGVPPGYGLFTAGSTTMLRVLLDAGADPTLRNSDGATALFNLAAVGANECIEILIEAGADARAAGIDGTTALMWAARNGHLETVRLLLEHGAEPNVVSDDGRSPRSWAEENEHPEVVTLLKAAESGTPRR